MSETFEPKPITPTGTEDAATAGRSALSTWHGTASIRSSHILLIDDARSIHRLVATWLKHDSHRVSIATGGQDGLDQAIDTRPDLILLDIDIPDRDGFDVCRALKGNPETIGIPVIFLTASTDVEQKIKGLDLGAVDYISKPFHPAEFRARVRAALRTKHLLDLLSVKAQVDGLTGLRNRRHLDERLNALASLMRRGGAPFSCVMADIDNFKSLNDAHGHAFGDEVLIEVAEAFVRTCRAEDVLCRYGGEELCVLTPEVSIIGATKLAERLRAAVEAIQFRVAGEVLTVTASFGVAEADRFNPMSAVRNADSALYTAKAAGRNCVRTFKPTNVAAA